MLINHRGVTFQGLNMDIGHLRHIRWVKDDDPKSQINDKPELKQNNKSAAQNRWIAYNRMRGQYASAMEHAAPEAFWVDKTKCSYANSNGQIENPTLKPCAEGISAVKAIAIAQSEGQKIYTINKQNAQTALAKLPIGGEVGSEIRNAVNAGKEVTVHEKSINKHGWKGFGYIVIDPETGAGAYLIEGSGNGGILFTIFTHALLFFLWFLVIVGMSSLFILLGGAILTFVSFGIPMLGVAFAGLSLAGKLAVIGLGIWTYSHFFLEGCYRAIGKFIGNILPGFASLRSAKDLSTAMALLFTGTAKDIYQSFIEGC